MSREDGTEDDEVVSFWSSASELFDSTLANVDSPNTEWAHAEETSDENRTWHGILEISSNENL